MEKVKPYIGKEPYIFISYAHKDSKDVLPIIERLIADGYRVWYDEGIVPGSEWDDNIASHIEGCSCMLAIMSNSYMASNNCKDELNYARDLDKPRLLIYLCEVDMPGGMKMRLNRLQAIHKYTYGSENAFFTKVYEAEMLVECKGEFTVPEPLEDESDLLFYEGDAVVGASSDIENAVIKEGTKIIAEGAFQFYENLKSVKIPDTVTDIEMSAFSGCASLRELHIPSSVVTIDMAFDNVRCLEKITVAKDNKYFHSQNNCLIETKKNNLILGCKNSIIPTDGSVLYIDINAFSGCENLKYINLPKGLRFICGGAFAFCYALTSITIPDTVTYIGTTAFMDCESLKEVTLPSKLKDIENGTFAGCYSLEKIVIPSNVRTIRFDAFGGCRSLKSVTIPRSVEMIDTSVFKRCEKLTEIIYEGTSVQWNAIKKKDGWCDETPSFKIVCSDGVIYKQ